jgi:hypothetical protein
MRYVPVFYSISVARVRAGKEFAVVVRRPRNTMGHFLLRSGRVVSSLSIAKARSIRRPYRGSGFGCLPSFDVLFLGSAHRRPGFATPNLGVAGGCRHRALSTTVL